MDEAKLEQFMGMMVGYMTGSALCLLLGSAMSWASTEQWRAQVR